MSSDTHVINDNLLKIENLITALNYLYEWTKTRNDENLKLITDEKIVSIITDLILNNYSIQRRMVRFIQNEYGTTLIREVAFDVMEKIDNDIEAFVNKRVDTRLKELGVQTTSELI